ncbi:MAG: HAD family phosphatase [Tetrasphaera sp.]
MAAVMWDMDGTLVDTEPYWIAAEHELVANHGGHWSEEFAHQLVGNPLLVSAQFIIDNSPVSLSPEEVVAALLDRVVAQVTEHVPWRPGALDLLADLRAGGIPCALVTMSWRRLADAVTSAMPGPPFEVVITGEHVENGKPHPEPYLAAAAALGVDPGDCVAIEDSAKGVASAVAAGIPTIAVPHVVPIPPLAGAVQIDTLAGLTTAQLRQLTAGLAARSG